jgi:membrane associated rhomboid family serine protease
MRHFHRESMENLAQICFSIAMSYASWRLKAGLPPATFALLALLIGMYLLQLLAETALGLELARAFGLSVAGMFKGHLWQFLTYQLLHGGPFHLLLNLLMFLFLGAEVERAIGPRHFLVLYALSGVLGGLGWLLLIYPYEGVCIGASAAIFGLLSAFAVLYPQREVTLLLFLVFPVTLKARTIAVALGAVQLLFSISPNVGGIAYSAHLAGALAGFVYTAAVFRPDWIRAWRDGIEHRRRAAQARRAEEDAARVDRLLDKIARDGMHTLSPAERKFLEDAARRRRSR